MRLDSVVSTIQCFLKNGDWKLKNKNIFIVYTFFYILLLKKKSLIILLFYDVRFRLFNLVLTAFFELCSRGGFRLCVPDII